MTVSAAVTVAASAKINLALRVGGRRPDGYHALATLFQAVDLADELTVVTAGSGLRLTVVGAEAAGVPTGEDNLVLQALRLLAGHTGHDLAVAGVGVGVHLTKRIPAAAGLAGGSADAAAALLAADALWQTHLPRAELLDLAATLGADVPFSLTGGTAVGTSRGDVLTPALARGRFHWVLALSEHRLPTPAVFAELDRVRPLAVADELALAPGLLAAVRAGDPVALGRALTNDLQAPAITLVPALRVCLDAGTRLGALGSVVCGSGPTCAFLVPDAGTAATFAVALAAARVARRVLAVTGPAPGARIVSAVA
jgi:4-diphosphocytidyl-2-C-methyl-D-erythritol kinase